MGDHEELTSAHADRFIRLTIVSPRVTYAVLLIATVGIGLAVYGNLFGLGPVVRDVLGDALWAMMIVWIFSVAAPSTHIVWRAGWSLLVCVAVELSQLVHTPTLDSIRATGPGHLVLGSGFDPRDLIAYLLGVVVAALLDAKAVRR